MEDVEALGKRVFFITRIGQPSSPERERSDDLMNLLLEPLLEEINPELKLYRADDMIQQGRITDRMYHHLAHCRFVVADVTGMNRNVYYELGVAHSHHRPVVLITDTTSDLPFDTGGEAHVLLPGDGPILGRDVLAHRERLRAALEEAEVEAANGKPTGPVASALAQLKTPDLSQAEANELLRSSFRELSERVAALEEQPKRIAFGGEGSGGIRFVENAGNIRHFEPASPFSSRSKRSLNRVLIELGAEHYHGEVDLMFSPRGDEARLSFPDRQSLAIKMSSHPTILANYLIDELRLDDDSASMLRLAAQDGPNAVGLG